MISKFFSQTNLSLFLLHHFARTCILKHNFYTVYANVLHIKKLFVRASSAKSITIMCIQNATYWICLLYCWRHSFSHLELHQLPTGQVCSIQASQALADANVCVDTLEYPVQFEWLLRHLFSCFELHESSYCSALFSNLHYISSIRNQKTQQQTEAEAVTTIKPQGRCKHSITNWDRTPFCTHWCSKCRTLLTYLVWFLLTYINIHYYIRLKHQWIQKAVRSRLVIECLQRPCGLMIVTAPAFVCHWVRAW